MTEGKSYKLSNVVVWSYQNAKYLSMPKENVSLVEIGNIGEVLKMILRRVAPLCTTLK
jgi:hypothetical protein